MNKQNGIQITRTIPIKVTLTKSQIARLEKEVVKRDNVRSACDYSGINRRTLKKALKGETQIKQEQRDRLIEFCNILKTA